MEKIADIVKSQGGVITTGELSGRAEYQRLLRAVEQNKLIRIRQGVYADPDAMLNTMIDVERIIPGGVVCLYNAWAFYQLSTTVPPAFCIAIDAKRKVSLPEALPINLYYWKKDYLTLGIMEQEVSGYKVHMGRPLQTI